jgi:transcriptional regulator with PAS, ATPase and Fis domain
LRRPESTDDLLSLLNKGSSNQFLSLADVGLIVLLGPKRSHLEVREPEPVVLVLNADKKLTKALGIARKGAAGLTGTYSAVAAERLARDLASLVAQSIEAPPNQDCELIDGHHLIGESPDMLEIKSYISRVAPTSSNVLITGETGTGKELVAELVQKNSPRRNAGFACFNCAAIPDSLLESELFGYGRGAFTGAHSAYDGKLESADGGTVFFDEIGDMSMQAQAKVLRLLENKEIQPLGAKRPRKVDFRIIAATNQDVDSPESATRFRRDLYFRLNIGRIHIPPLRERPMDIPLLLSHFLNHLNAQFGRQVEGFSKTAWDHLIAYKWPGNIRELKNVMEALFVNLPRGRVATLELPERMQRQMSSAAILPPDEQRELVRALRSADGNKSKAARQLHWSRMTLYRKMAKYSMEPVPGNRKPASPENLRPE